MRLLAEAYYGDPEEGLLAGYNFFCPACDRLHHLRMSDHPSGVQGRAKWSFDGDMERPTFSPSLLLFRVRTGSEVRETICHLFVRGGQIVYCGDCPHEYAGKTVPMVDLDAPAMRKRFGSPRDHPVSP